MRTKELKHLSQLRLNDRVILRNFDFLNRHFSQYSKQELAVTSIDRTDALIRVSLPDGVLWTAPYYFFRVIEPDLLSDRHIISVLSA